MSIKVPNAIKPMLATATTSLPPGKWVAERKWDGFRLIVEVSDDDVLAYTRTGNRYELPQHLLHELVQLGVGVYDGELIVPGGYSSSVADLANRKKLEYVIFDLLVSSYRDIMAEPWNMRRLRLENLLDDQDGSPIRLGEYTDISSWSDVEEMVGKIWEEGGEGVILKNVNAPYRTGKRTKTFLKVKQCQPAVLTIIGFAPSEGEIMNYGNYGTAILEDGTGVFVPVKILDDSVRDRLAKEETSMTRELIDGGVAWRSVRLISGKKVDFHTAHPWVGRKLHIEYQFKTPDGSYRHPRWDRLDGE